MQIFFSKRILKVQNFIPKYPSSFTLEPVLKMAEEIKEKLKVCVQAYTKKGGKTWS